MGNAAEMVVPLVDPLLGLTLREYLEEKRNAEPGPEAGRNDVRQRRRIVEQALLLFEHFYANRPIKESLHAAEPIRLLELLRNELDREERRLERRPRPDVAEQDIWADRLAFHRRLSEIFASVRDRHVGYSLFGLMDPSRADRPFNAYLGFEVEAFFEPGSADATPPRPRYLVSHVVPRIKRAAAAGRGARFDEGVEVLSWNGVPVARAVELNAVRQAGSNPAARHARGLSLLTLRPLDAAPPPDEEYVIVTFRDAAGERGEVRFDWRLIPSEPALGGRRLRSNLAAGVRPDPRGEAVATTTLPLLVAAWKLPPRQAADGSSRCFGYLRIFSFRHSRLQEGGTSPEDRFVDEIRRLVDVMAEQAPDGLIVDVRDNPGGNIRAGERLLQLLTPRRIEPARFEFLATPQLLELVRRNPVWSRWESSLLEAQDTGALFSRGFPITSPEACNAIGQRYYGPVVLITSALSYSTADVFAAGFQDHRIGKVLGVDDSTGAGGANVIEHHELVQRAKNQRPPERAELGPYGQYVPAPEVLDELPLEELPRGVRMRVAVRRAVRAGDGSGVVLEDLGVRSDERHFMTRDDLLDHNRDLLEKAQSLLEGMPRRRLRVTRSGGRITVEADEVTRVDLYVDGRPLRSRRVPPKTIHWEVPASGHLRLEAFARNEDGEEALVATRLESSRPRASEPGDDLDDAYDFEGDAIGALRQELFSPRDPDEA